MANRLSIEAEPCDEVVALASFLRGRRQARGVEWGGVEAGAEATLARMKATCREIGTLAARVGTGLRVEPASMGVCYSELAGLVTCHGAVDLDEVMQRSREVWRHLVDLLLALSRLEGYVIQVRLGRNVCSIDDAIRAATPERAVPRTDRAGQSAPRDERRRARRPGEQAEERPPRGRQSSDGETRAPNPGESWYPGAGRGAYGWNRPQWGARPNEARRAPPRESPRPPPRRPEPRPQTDPVQFFLSRTGLLRPFDVLGLKKAFRRVVRELHPDHRPGDANAHEEFCLFKRGYDDLLREAGGG